LNPGTEKKINNAIRLDRFTVVTAVEKRKTCRGNAIFMKKYDLA
jgi:hypothetical protein